MMSDKPVKISIDSVICPYCEEVLGTYPDDFLEGEKFLW